MGSLSLAYCRSIHLFFLRRLQYCCCLAVGSVLPWDEVRTDLVGVKENNAEVEESSESREEEENLILTLLSFME